MVSDFLNRTLHSRALYLVQSIAHDSYKLLVQYKMEPGKIEFYQIILYLSTFCTLRTLRVVVTVPGSIQPATAPI